jgi:hypothetical protein
MFNLFTSTKIKNILKDYRTYRWFFTSGKSLVVGGKSDEQNEITIKYFLKPEYTILHTTEPGSPFMIIQNEDPSKEEIKEAAIFCGCFSKAWKKSKKISIDIFKGNQIYKIKSMKTGTFGVKGKKEMMNIKPELILIIQKGKLRAVPNPNGEEKLAKITQGKLTKAEATEKIFKIIQDKYNLPISRDEIMQAIPSNKLDVK